MIYDLNIFAAFLIFKSNSKSKAYKELVGLEYFNFMLVYLMVDFLINM